MVQPHFIATGGGSAKTEYDARMGLVIGNFLKDDQTSIVPRNIVNGVETTYFYIDEVIVEPCSGRFPDEMIFAEDSTICQGESLGLAAAPIKNARYLWENVSADSIFNSEKIRLD